MKKLIYICLAVSIVAFPACSNQEQAENFETISQDQIPTAEDIKFKEPSSAPEESTLTKEQEEILAKHQEKKEERAKRNAELNKEFFESQDELINKYKKLTEEQNRKYGL